METNTRSGSWPRRLLFLLVLGVLFAVGVLQYQWFSRSAASEIEATIRGLEVTVRQTAFREFQRYTPLVADLQDWGPGKTEGARLLLQRFIKSYGPEGVTPGLVAWVGRVRVDNKVWEFLAADGAWTRKPIEGQPWARFLTVTTSGPAGATLISSERDNGGQTLFIRTSDSQEALLLGIDQTRFWNSYLVPSLKETFPGATVSVETGHPSSISEDRQEFASDRYTFNPVSALVSGSTIPQSIVVPLPRFLDLAGRKPPNPPPRDNLSSAANLGPDWAQIVVTLPDDASVLTIEQRLAWNWLGGTLLLIVLAAVFGLVLRQSSRLDDLRWREREFVASVSHELRTPLTVIQSAADNFTQGIVTADRQGRYGQLILDQAQRLGRMIEEMLSFAQAESGTQARQPVLLVFHPWLQDLRPSLEALAHQRQIAIVWDVAGVPESGWTDPEGLRLVLENLVVNALNHAYPPPGPDQGPRAVRVTLRFLVSGRIELTVDDDGRGIDPQEARKVFEPFYRDQVSRRRQERGSGLGLFLAQRQARQMGGRLVLESPWRRIDGIKRPGCRFVLTIPFRVDEEVHHGR